MAACVQASQASYCQGQVVGGNHCSGPFFGSSYHWRGHRGRDHRQCTNELDVWALRMLLQFPRQTQGLANHVR